MRDWRRRWPVFAATTAALVAAAVGAGLWLWPAPQAQPAPPVARPFEEFTCQDGGKLDLGRRTVPERRLLDAGFVATEAVMCTTETRHYPGEGEFEVVIEKRAQSGLADLVRALRAPPEPPPLNLICTGGELGFPLFLLGDATGRIVAPDMTDANYGMCGDPAKGRAIRTLHKLPWEIVSERRGRRTQTEAQLHSYCAPRQLADPFAAARVAPSVHVFRSIRPSAGLRACLYAKTSPTAPVANIQKGDGLILPERDSVLRRLRRATPPLPCPQPATEFATLYPLDPKTPDIAVELNGCGRVLSGGRVVARLLANQRDEVKAALQAAMPY